MVKLLKSLTLLVFLILLSPSLFGQGNDWFKLKKAEKLYTYGKINGSILKYRNVLENDPNNVIANYELGRIYLINKEIYDQAEKYFEKSIHSFGEKDSLYLAYFYLAETEKLLGQYPEAIENYTFFKKYGLTKKNPKKILASDIDLKINECKLAKLAIAEKELMNIEVVNLGSDINSELSEYCSIFFNDTKQLMYTARYQDNKKERKYLDLKYYEAGYSQTDTSAPKPLRVDDAKLNRVHFSVVSKSPSGDTIVFYKDNKLWLSIKNQEGIGKPELMPEQINRSYYQPHGVFTPDQKYFIFSSSDKKIQLDLYIVELKEDGSWSEAMPLSDKINTAANEDSPFLSADGNILYFSSDKSGGFGQYDIYRSIMTNGEWGIPENMGIPINSPGNDIFFTINEDGETGFLSSNRGGGFGAMDIYMFTKKPYPTFDCDLALTNPENNVSMDLLSEPVKDQLVILDVSRTKFKDAKIRNTFWRVDGEVLKFDHVVLNYVFTSAGKHEVTAQIYGYDRKLDTYEMECVNKTIEVAEEGLLFLNIDLERKQRKGESIAMQTHVANLNYPKTATYKWYIDGVYHQEGDTMINYTFKDTGVHVVRVEASIEDQLTKEEFKTISERAIYVYDENSIYASNYIEVPEIELVDNINPTTGKVNVLQAELYNLPNDRRVFYEWYINNEVVKGRTTSLLKYDFKPLEVVKVVSYIMHEKEEPEFTLETTKIIPEFYVEDTVRADEFAHNNTALTDSIQKNSNNAKHTNNSDDSKQLEAIAGQNTIDNNPVETGALGTIKPVYFSFDKYYLSAAAKVIINNNIAILKANKGFVIVLEGNTDSFGAAAYNLRLSEKRAKAVYDYLKLKGISDDQIQGVNSNGEKLPKAANTLSNGKDNPKGRQENRRVDFTIVKR
ncbi:OmpA family protein [Putridiphycobacter roseus]|nr:OmpA family protein [Putridiphycobacter roseus]